MSLPLPPTSQPPIKRNRYAGDEASDGRIDVAIPLDDPRRARLRSILREMRTLRLEGTKIRRELRTEARAKVPDLDQCRHCNARFHRNRKGVARAQCPECRSRDWQPLPPAYQAAVEPSPQPPVIMVDPLIVASKRTGLPLPPGFIPTTRYSLDGGKTWRTEDLDLYEPSEPNADHDYYALARAAEEAEDAQ